MNNNPVLNDSITSLETPFLNDIIFKWKYSIIYFCLCIKCTETGFYLVLQYLLNHNICTLYEKISMKFTTSWIINSQHQINLFLTCIICKQTMPLSFCGNAIIWSMGINMQEFTVHWKTWDCAAIWIWATENIYQPDITLQNKFSNSLKKIDISV